MAKATIYSFLVTSIVTLLGLDDASKLEKFFNGEVKKFNTEIKKLQANLKNLALKREIAVDEYTNKMEDAEQTLADSFLNVKVEDIATNAEAKSFSGDYWRRIDNAQATIDFLKKEDEDAIETYDKRVADTEDQMAKYQARIDKLTAKA